MCPTVPADVLTETAVDLVFYGVDTVADIYLNDELIGSTKNMFIRYKYNVKSCLKVSERETIKRCVVIFCCFS